MEAQRGRSSCDVPSTGLIIVYDICTGYRLLAATSVFSNLTRLSLSS